MMKTLTHLKDLYRQQCRHAVIPQVVQQTRNTAHVLNRGQHQQARHVVTQLNHLDIVEPVADSVITADTWGQGGGRGEGGCEGGGEQWSPGKTQTAHL